MLDHVMIEDCIERRVVKRQTKDIALRKAQSFSGRKIDTSIQPDVYGIDLRFKSIMEIRRLPPVAAASDENTCVMKSTAIMLFHEGAEEASTRMSGDEGRWRSTLVGREACEIANCPAIHRTNPLIWYRTFRGVGRPRIDFARS